MYNTFKPEQPVGLMDFEKASGSDSTYSPRIGRPSGSGASTSRKAPRSELRIYVFSQIDTYGSNIHDGLSPSFD